MSIAENAQKLTAQLNDALSNRAQVDEQIIGLRNTIQGINLGVELQKEIQAEADKAAAQNEMEAAADLDI